MEISEQFANNKVEIKKFFKIFKFKKDTFFFDFFMKLEKDTFFEDFI